MSDGQTNNSSDTKQDSTPERSSNEQTFVEHEPEKAPEKPLSKFDQIVIKFVEQSEQRYETVGDWFFDDNRNLVITVSRLSDPRYTMAIALHELIEAVMCTANGVTPEMVDEFDMDKGADYDEPGRHPSAPYHKEHIYATAAERRFIETLGVKWEDYNAQVTSKGEHHGNEAAR